MHIVVLLTELITILLQNTTGLFPSKIKRKFVPTSRHEVFPMNGIEANNKSNCIAPLILTRNLGSD